MRINEYTKNDLLKEYSLENKIKEIFVAKDASKIKEKITELLQLPLQEKEADQANHLRYALIEQVIFYLDQMTSLDLCSEKDKNLAYKIIESIFAQQPSLAKYRDHKGLNLLMLATNKGFDFIVELCIRYGSELDGKCESEGHYHQYQPGQTALMFSLSRDYSPKFVAKLLSEQTSSQNIEAFLKNIYPMTFIHQLERVNNHGYIPGALKLCGEKIMKHNMLAAKGIRRYYLDLREFHLENAQFLKGVYASKAPDKKDNNDKQAPISLKRINGQEKIIKTIQKFLKPSFEAYKRKIEIYEIHRQRAIIEIRDNGENQLPDPEPIYA